MYASDYFYSLFDCCIDPISRVYFSEDYLFCKRWIEIGGELWLDINTNLNHTGIIDYKGCIGLIIGEADVLNKDAQALQKQDDIKILQELSLQEIPQETPQQQQFIDIIKTAQHC